MILGFILVAGGYAVFYWGIHHFPGVDCPDNAGGCTCRYSLFDLLGVPSTWQITKGTPLQLNPPPPNQTSVGGIPNAPEVPNRPTQPQLPNNGNTPQPLNPGPTPELPSPALPELPPVVVA